MKAISEITKEDLIKIAKMEGFENKKSDTVHLYLDQVGKTCLENFISGLMGLEYKTFLFLKRRYAI